MTKKEFVQNFSAEQTEAINNLKEAINRLADLNVNVIADVDDNSLVFVNTECLVKYDSGSARIDYEPEKREYAVCLSDLESWKPKGDLFGCYYEHNCRYLKIDPWEVLQSFRKVLETE